MIVTVLTAVLVTAVAANAAPNITMRVSPSKVPAGDTVHMTGVFEPNTGGKFISEAFLHDADHDFAGVGAVDFTTDAAGRYSTNARIPSNRKPGRYAISVRSGGGNVGSPASVVVVAARPPTGVPAGSGGYAASTSPGTRYLQATMVGVGVLLLAAAGFGVRRLRRYPR